MDLAKIRKAIGGGVAGAIAALGGTGGVAVTLPAGSPSWEHYALAALAGFVVGFAVVYQTPANKPS